ncbi:MAG: fructose PTS transporter subunit IIA [Lachnospiraceae bacterium]|nr:fructose PTS transporter subunit IIA [Lachnospiraceae bacterium]
MLINENLVKLNLEADNQKEALKSLAEAAFEQGKVSSVEEYVGAVLERESEYSTAVGFGVAIPHGKTDAVKEPFLMFASVKAMDWKALDGEPIDLIFLIGVPEKEAGSLHLKILASLSRKLMKEDFRNSLRDVKTEAELIELLKNSEIGI